MAASLWSLHQVNEEQSKNFKYIGIYCIAGYIHICSPFPALIDTHYLMKKSTTRQQNCYGICSQACHALNIGFPLAFDFKKI